MTINQQFRVYSIYAKYVNIDPASLKTLMDASTNLFISDVRERDEYCSGHIPGAIRLSWNSGQFAAQYDSILPDSGNIVLACRTGNRSLEALNHLWNMQFWAGHDEMVLYNLTGGMQGTGGWSYAVDICRSVSPGINLLLMDP